MRRRCAAELAALFATVLFGTPALACETGGPCRVEGGQYHMRLPARAVTNARVPAIVMLHGFRDSAAAMMSYPDLADALGVAGFALIAPDGEGGAWSVPGAPARARADAAFLAAVIEDAAARFPIDPDRVVLAGFSLGASLAWSMACADGARWPRVLAVAGAFWEPIPESCRGPAPRLLHVHGTSDRTVPLAGRTLRERYRQADVFTSFARLCPGAREREAASFAGMPCRARDCAGARQEICLHPGGHDLDGRWIALGGARLLAD